MADFAYYYADWIWPSHETDLMKSMLLFFDGIALALGPKEAAWVIDRDPILAAPLNELGLLRNFNPETEIDAATANCLADTLNELAKHHFKWLRDDDRRRVARSPLHYGAGAAPRAAARFEKTLRKRGLLTRAADNGLVHMDPEARTLVLIVFARVLRLALADKEISLHPVEVKRSQGASITDDALASYVRYTGSKAGRHLQTPLLVSSRFRDDLDIVGVDLSRVPLDEVLSFRAEHGEQYRAYARDLRAFMSEVNRDPASAELLTRERSELIHDQAAELRQISRRSFGARSSSLAFSLVGAVWSAAHGHDVLSSLFATGAAIPQFLPMPAPASAYSYILETVKLDP